MIDVNINAVTQSFPGSLEAEFLEAYTKSSLRHIRMSLAMAMLMYGIFGILDGWLMPEVKIKLWVIRYGIFIPFTLCIFIASFSGYFEKIMQIAIAAVILVAGEGIVAMILLASPTADHSYYAGLILVIMFGHTFIKLRFIWASAASLIIVLSYEIVAIWMITTPPAVLYSNNFFFISANVIGMFASYSVEKGWRKEFMQKRLLDIEKNNVETINRKLKKSVDDRTAQLSQTNESLKQKIEEYRSSVRALGESEEKYRTIIEGIEEGYFELDLEGRILFFNSSMCKIIGRSQEELVGIKVQNYFDAETKKNISQFYNKIYQTGKSAKLVDFEINTADNDRITLEISSTILRDSSGRTVGFRNVARDVTKRKK